MVRWQVIFRGRVQGVGFRYMVYEIAKDFDVVGSVMNRNDGTVDLICEGSANVLDRFVSAVLERRIGYVSDHQIDEAEPTGEFKGFEIRG